jgi:hypothetical protein
MSSVNYINSRLREQCDSTATKSCSVARHAGGKGERYSSYSFLTSAPHVGEWSASRLGRALPPGKGSPVPTG